MGSGPRRSGNEVSGRAARAFKDDCSRTFPHGMARRIVGLNTCPDPSPERTIDAFATCRSSQLPSRRSLDAEMRAAAGVTCLTG